MVYHRVHMLDDILKSDVYQIRKDNLYGEVARQLPPTVVWDRCVLCNQRQERTHFLLEEWMGFLYVAKTRFVLHTGQNSLPKKTQ